MSNSNQPQYVRVNPFARAAASPPKPDPATPTEPVPALAPPGPTKAELDALATAVRRRVTRLVIIFVGICLLLVAGEIWITQELLNRQRSAVDENSAIIIEQTRRFRNSLNVAEMQLKQMVLDAQIHRRSLDTIASNAQMAYAIILSNNISVAAASRTAAATAKSVESDALAVRDASRASQQLEIEFNVALARIRKDYLTMSSNLITAFEADLKGRSTLLDKRVKEAESLLANVKNSATEAEKLRKTIEASLAALRSTPPPPAVAPVPALAPAAVNPMTPAPAPPVAVPAPKPVAPTTAPAAIQPAPVQKTVAPTNPPAVSPPPASPQAKN